MTSSVWRISHLLIAIISTVFLLTASVTGGIIAVDNCLKSTKNTATADLSGVNLAESIPVLQKKFSQVNALEVNENHELIIDALDDNGNEIKSVVDPKSGKIIGNRIKESQFMKQVISLHRSLFLHETGRFIVGIVAFLLMLMALSGFVLILKRQGGISKIFHKISKEHWPQYLHVVSGRLMLIPLLIIAGSGTFLFLKRFKLLPEEKNHTVKHTPNQIAKNQKIADLEVFKNINFSQVKKIEFPFTADDPEDIFTLKLADRELEVKQGTGEIIKDVRYPWTAAAYNLSYTIHTGKSSGWWSLFLAVSSAAVLIFIYSGFAITLKRKKRPFKNKFAANDSDIIMLVGSENGDTYRFAHKIYDQFLAAGRKIYLADLNSYQYFPNIKELLIFTSTYGDGDAPGNADRFLSLLKKHSLPENTKYSVVGFGSDFYENFCGFAKKIERKFEENKTLKQLLPLFTVNQNSVQDFILWVKSYNKATDNQLVEDAEYYLPKNKKRDELTVIAKTELSKDNNIFTVTFKKKSGKEFASGDILSIFPFGNAVARQYSIGKVEKNLQLFVKLHEHGVGSNYLHDLKVGDCVQAFIQKNASFHFPNGEKEVIMIANGTGIAPFLGMLEEQHRNTKKYLYCGFRHDCSQTADVENIMQKNISDGRLDFYKTAFSCGSQPKYVTDLLHSDINFITEKIRSGAVVMICGSTAMQRDVEAILEQIICPETYPSVAEMRASKKLLTDCY